MCVSHTTNMEALADTNKRRQVEKERRNDQRQNGKTERGQGGAKMNEAHMNEAHMNERPSLCAHREDTKWSSSFKERRNDQRQNGNCFSKWKNRERTGRGKNILLSLAVYWVRQRECVDKSVS